MGRGYMGDVRQLYPYLSSFLALFVIHESAVTSPSPWHVRVMDVDSINGWKIRIKIKHSSASRCVRFTGRFGPHVIHTHMHVYITVRGLQYSTSHKYKKPKEVLLYTSLKMTPLLFIYSVSKLCKHELNLYTSLLQSSEQLQTTRYTRRHKILHTCL